MPSSAPDGGWLGAALSNHHLWNSTGIAERVERVCVLDPALAPEEIATSLVENAVLDTVMTNSFGFGGTNGTLVFRRPQ